MRIIIFILRSLLLSSLLLQNGLARSEPLRPELSPLEMSDRDLYEKMEEFSASASTEDIRQAEAYWLSVKGKKEIDANEFAYLFVHQAGVSSLTSSELKEVFLAAQPQLKRHADYIRCLFLGTIENTSPECVFSPENEARYLEQGMFAAHLYYSRLSEIYQDRGKNLLAIDAIEKALKTISKEKVSPVLKIRALVNLAHLVSEHDPLKGLTYHKQVLDLSLQENYANYAGQQYYNLAKSLLNQMEEKRIGLPGHFERLKPWLNQIDIFMKGTRDNLMNTPNEPYVHFLEGYYQQNYKLDYKASMAAYILARKQFLDQMNPIWAADSLRNIAQCEVQLGNLTAAAKTLELAQAEMLKAQGGELGPKDGELFNNLKIDILFGSRRFEEAFKLIKHQYRIMVQKFFDQSEQNYIQQTVLSGLAASEKEQKELEQKNALQATQLESASLIQKLFIALCFFCLAGLFLTAWLFQSSRRIKQQNQMIVAQSGEIMAQGAKLEGLLSSIEEGILKIDKNLIIDSEHSPHVQEIFGRDMHGKHLIQDLISICSFSADSSNRLHHSLEASLGSPAIAWEMNAESFPNNLYYQSRRLSFFWQPIVLQGMIDHVLLVIRDTTALFALELEAQGAHEQLDALTLSLKEIISFQASEAMALLDEIKSHLNQAGQPDFPQRVHTYKGIARSLGLRFLADALHEWEDCLKKDTSSPSRPDQLIQLGLDFYEQAQSILRQARLLPLQKNSLFSLMNRMEPDLRLLLKNQGMELESFKLNLSGEVPPEAQPMLEVILQHGLTNAVDHAYIRPWKEHRSRQKNAVLAIEISMNQDHCLVDISDEGIGLDWEQLKRMAQERNWIPTKNRPVSDLLFEQGFSTVSKVDQTSGRGLGLTAVQDLLKKAGGNATLLDNPEGRGTLLRCEWPFPHHQRLKQIS